MNKPDVTDFLEYGAENAKSMTEGADFYNESPRQFRARINEARRRGAVILSSPDKEASGYYLPKSNAEVRAYISFQQQRINSAREAMRSANEFLERGGFDSSKC